MTVPDDEAPGFDIDIGVAAPSGIARSRRSPGNRRRKLPIWAIVALAVFAGWVLGALTNAQAPADPVTAEPAANDPIPAEPSTPDATVDTGMRTVLLVQGALREVPIPADLQVIEDGISTPIIIDQMVGGSIPMAVGQADRRMLVVDDSVVFMALDSVMVFDPVRKTEPVEVARATYLMPGSNAGRVWAVTSGLRGVLDIDVDSQQVQAEYDLTDVGVPLGSFHAGLVVAPVDRTLGRFALWSPRTGIEVVPSIAAVSTFIDAGGNDVVIRTRQGLASYNVVSGSLTQTDYDISSSEQHRAIVSPDGSSLAIIERRSIVELSHVVVVDLDSGAIVDEFDTAFDWQVQWVSDDQVVFMTPVGRAVRLMVRDTSTGLSRLVTELAGPNYWVTVTE